MAIQLNQITDTFTPTTGKTVFNDIFFVGGSLSRAVPATKTGDFTVAASENWFICNKVGSDITVTLPSAASFPGRELMFKNIAGGSILSAGANVVPLTSSTTPGNNITGGTSGAGSWATIVSDGNNWIIMQA